MKKAIVMTIFATLWTPLAMAQDWFPVVTVTNTTVSDWPWSSHSENPSSKAYIFAVEKQPSKYLFSACSVPQYRDNECEQINAGPIHYSALSGLIVRGIGLNLNDLPLAAIFFQWGDALPTTRNFLEYPGPQFLDVLKGSGALPPVDTYTSGSPDGKLLFQQILYYAGTRLKKSNE